MKEDIVSASIPQPPAVTPLDLDDIQGIIVQGFRSYTHARHFILHIRPGQTAGARQFCGDLLPSGKGAISVTPATRWEPGYRPPYTLSFGVSNSGMKTLLGDAYNAVSGKSFGLFQPFRATVAATAKTVGDIDDSAPANWWKNGNWKLDAPPSNDPLDLLVTLYARNATDRDTYGAMLLDMIPAGTDGLPAVVPAFVQDSDPLDPPDSIHFGYVDGISQPRIAGYPDPDPSGQDPTPSSAFIINPDRTAVPPPPYTAHPFLANGCFGAFRLLHQDVGAFEAFLAQSGENADLVAAKMCGRWKDGTPLEVSPDKPEPLSDDARIDFAYLSARGGQQNPLPAPGFDTTGERCPYSSHTRRTHPRDDSAVKANSPAMRERHRVMRRAFAYGPPYATAPDADRGLVGLFMGANLNEQFEFLMQTWMNTGSFRTVDASPTSSGVDPLFGPQPSDTAPNVTSFYYLDEKTNAYVQAPGKMTRFVRTDGSLYVFLPGMAGLEHLSNGTIPPPSNPATTPA